MKTKRMKLAKIMLSSFLLLSLLSTQGCLREVNKSLTVDEAKANYYDGNYNRSFRLTEVLALEGNKKSQYALGYMYYYGIGAPQNKALGMAWIKKSAAQGHAPAMTALKKLENVQTG